MAPRLLDRHPPLRIVAPGSGGASRLLAHAALWLVVEAPAWNERRAAHLHLAVAPEDAARADAWELVDLSRHPLASAGRDVQLPWSEIETGLRDWVRHLELRLLRSEDVGLVSELLEPRTLFEQRVRQLLAPAIRTRLEEDRIQPLPTMPWRRRREKERRAGRRQSLAAGLSSVVARIEEQPVADPWDAIRRAEIGPLDVPRDLILVAPRSRDPMIAGRPRVS